MPGHYIEDDYSVFASRDRINFMFDGVQDYMPARMKERMKEWKIECYLMKRHNRYSEGYFHIDRYLKKHFPRNVNYTHNMLVIEQAREELNSWPEKDPATGYKFYKPLPAIMDRVFTDSASVEYGPYKMVKAMDMFLHLKDLRRALKANCTNLDLQQFEWHNHYSQGSGSNFTFEVPKPKMWRIGVLLHRLMRVGLPTCLPRLKRDILTKLNNVVVPTLRQESIPETILEDFAVWWLLNLGGNWTLKIADYERPFDRSFFARTQNITHLFTRYLQNYTLTFYSYLAPERVDLLPSDFIHQSMQFVYRYTEAGEATDPQREFELFRWYVLMPCIFLVQQTKELFTAENTAATFLPTNIEMVAISRYDQLNSARAQYAVCVILTNMVWGADGEGGRFRFFEEGETEYKEVFGKEYAEVKDKFYKVPQEPRKYRQTRMRNPYEWIPPVPSVIAG